MITIDLLRRAVELQFGTEVARRVDVATTAIDNLPSTGGGSFNTTVARLSNAPDNWSIVVKRIVGSPTREGWDREARVHGDGDWLDEHLPVGLMRPRVLAEHRTDRDVTLVFEDLGPSRPLANDDIVGAATLLSAFNASGAEPRAWWSANFIASEYQTLGNHSDLLDAARADRSLERLRRQLVALAAQAPELLASVDELPVGPAHLDAYSRNLIVGDTIGLIDWSNAGAAPLGTDPATLLVLTLDYLDVDASSIAELEGSIVDAMHAGLRGTASESAAAAATTCFRAVTRLRHLAMMMNALPMVERRDPAVSTIVGQPLDQIVEQWLAVGDHLLSS